MELIFTLLALLPFLLIFVLIVLLRWSALKTMPLVWFITAIITLFVWRINLNLLGASFIKGTFIALEIMLIIFGAVWIIEILKKKHQIKFLQNLLSGISEDIRIQALIITFLFGSLIEGVAGFGTPAALTAPLLVSLGFFPLTAVVISLIANSTAVSFGAAGTPILLGLGGLGFEPLILKEITRNVALFHSIASIIIPLAIVYFVIKYSKNHQKINNKKAFIETIPFAIVVWLSFVIPYFLTAWFIGPELPSIIGGLTGLVIVSFAAHYKILTPKNIMTFNNSKKPKLNLKKGILSIIPYILIILFLTLSRVILPIKENLIKLSLDINNIFATPISHNFLYLFTPSFYFIITGIICLFIYKATFKESKDTLKNTFEKIKYPTIALIFTLALVQLFIISGENIESMPLLLAQATSSLLNKFFVFLSPFIGLFGSFIAGSNTVSNLLFGSFQAETARTLGISIITLLSLQVIGGAVGNMIALHNVLAASATVNLKNQEGNIIRKTIVVSLLYGTIIAVIGAIILL